MAKGTIVAFVVLVMATGLLCQPRHEKSNHHHYHRHEADPNSSRASRLLYSPRIRTVGSSKNVDMHTVLRR